MPNRCFSTASFVAGLILVLPVLAGDAFKTTKTGLKISDVKVGKGTEAKPGVTVVVHYTGKLKDGKQFDSSRDRKDAFSFKLGGGRVIKGWDEGVLGMKVGGHRKLIIPSELGYGKKGFGETIPPDAELHFDIELLGVL